MQNENYKTDAEMEAELTQMQSIQEIVAMNGPAKIAIVAVSDMPFAELRTLAQIHGVEAFETKDESMFLLYGERIEVWRVVAAMRIE